MTAAPITPVAVIIATRGRAVRVARAAESVLASDYPSVHLCVVDQSDDDATAAALRHLADDPRVGIVRASPRGLAAARNLGVTLTEAPIVAFTDDDCEVSRGWLEGIAAGFAGDTRIGVVFGSVQAGDYDRAAGFIPAYQVARPFRACGVSRKAQIEGIGACMAVRRSTWEALGGFDELLGAGAPFRSAEDSDFAMRALLAGQWVHETPDAVVTHYGFRAWREGRRLIEGYMFGLGTVNAKMLRLGRLGAFRPVVELAWRWVAGGPIVDLNHRPPRVMRLVAFLRGVSMGLRTPLDRASGRFAPSRHR
jgi:GT2 family glycosyltransferase